MSKRETIQIHQTGLFIFFFSRSRIMSLFSLGFEDSCRFLCGLDCINTDTVPTVDSHWILQEMKTGLDS